MEKPKFHLFVCSSARLTGEIKGVCAQKEGVDIARALIEEVQDRGIDDQVMVTTTGCLGLCSMGPVVMVYPEQTWYGKVAMGDVEEILDAIEEESVVERLLI
ncbi:(2Fe-2S) ferredoxin domain-containing protein [Anaerotalea alkaliphila]|uniref:(2Fe-2S) ferredoxin domain-containing protein n=1 Tax=Anaerotalea alkaliphila TaxID=2662126 RepID=A0A7X5HTR0_9FIRM|nr:(2Fe-2S) ferredoxin domain-containing protein [Anaerotalea alkaliphila]NDL66502.1 (2Fe-2S) ferredoxin domain-containing protein [Anaerotalea alkaliphila]